MDNIGWSLILKKKESKLEDDVNVDVDVNVNVDVDVKKCNNNRR
jgi:hypothetical protein